jgi:hypothetical protein
MENLLNLVPAWVLAILCACISALFFSMALWLIRKRTSPEVLKKNHEVAGFLIGIIGALYGVLLGFIVVAVWEDYKDVEDITSKEVNILSDLYRDCSAISHAEAKEAQNAIKAYTQSVIADEWPHLKWGGGSEKTISIYDQLPRTIYKINPDSAREEIIYASIINHLRQLSDNRRLRLAAASYHIPTLIWFVLILGGIITIGFTFFFSLDNFKMQQLMTVIMAVLLALIMFLGVALENPFKGSLAITPDGFERLLKVNFPDADKTR